MERQEYDLACQQLFQPKPLELHLEADASLHDLILGGYDTILSRVLTPQNVAKLESQEKRQFQPLLITACQREVPNMRVIGLLVEQLGIGLDSRAQHSPGWSSRPDCGPTALHVLVRGSHWWQATQGLPYLIQKGANRELRDERALTPLNDTLQALGDPNLNRKAVNTLLQQGADPNSGDDQGTTCLARAAKDMEIFQLLIRHGAIVTHSAMAAAI